MFFKMYLTLYHEIFRFSQRRILILESRVFILDLFKCLSRLVSLELLLNKNTKEEMSLLWAEECDSLGSKVNKGKL